MAEDVRIVLCGRLSVEVDGCVCTDAIPGRQGRLLLIYLALHRHRPVSRDELADAIWRDRPPAAAGGSLNALISKLRSAVGPNVIVGTTSLQLADSVSVDLDAARRAVDDARTRLENGDYDDARDHAVCAVELTARGLVPDHEAEWLDEQRRDLEEVRLQALECLGEAGLALGSQALPEARRAAAALISESPYRESGHLLNMRALAAEGNVAEAIRAYHALRRMLDEELGILPGSRVQELVNRLLGGEDAAAHELRPRAGHGHERSQALGMPRFATRTHARFVGREGELERLKVLLAQARLGRRQLGLVEGEPGIGKTRLAEQFAVSCRSEGVSVLAGRCDAEAIVPYQPFIQALRPYVATSQPADVRDRLGIHAEALSSLLPEAVGRAGAAELERGPRERYRLFEAVCALLNEIMADGPAVLILDDLHWADKPTLLMLRHLVRVEDEAPLVIVGIYRQTECEPDLLDVLTDLRREHFFETIRLSGLDELQSSELVAELSDRPLRGDDDRRLWLETKGNPFFLEEVVRHIAGGEVDVTTIPEGVRAVIRRRLARRSDDVRRVLAVGAVVGQEFSIELVEQVQELADLSQDRLYDALDEAVAAQLIDEVQEEDFGRFQFSHSLMRVTILEDLTMARRARLHEHIGEALEMVTDDEGAAQFAELAYHFLAAPPNRAAEKAIRYAIKAGHEAARMLAFEEAERLYTRALAAIERHGGSDADRRALLLALGDVQIKLAAADAGRATFARALALARESDDAQSFGLAALGLGARSLMQGGMTDEPEIVILEEALNRLPAVDSPLRARLLGRLATELSFSDRRERCASLSEQAVAIARRTDDPSAYSFALTSRHWCLWWPENLKDRLAAARDLLALGERTGKKTIVLEGHRWCMLDLLELGDIPAVDAEIDAYAQLANERRLASEQWYVHLFRAMRMLLDGHLSDVERTAGEALRVGRLVQPANAEQGHTLQMVALRREQGRLAEMEAEVADRTRRYPAVPGWRCVLAWLHGEIGRTEDAARELGALAEEGFRDIPRDGIWLGAIAYLADTCAAVRAREHAGTLYDLLAPYGDRTVIAGWAATCAGSASRQLGRLAAMLGRRSDAAVHFEQAMKMNRGMGAQPWLVRTQLQYAQALLQEPEAGDLRRAVRMLRHALATAEELGLHQLAHDVTAALRAPAYAWQER